MPMTVGEGAQDPVRKPAVFSNQKLVPSKEHEMKITKGLPKAYDCSLSPNGCCWDGRTPAFGPAGKGCPQCRDVYEDFCKRTKKFCNYPMVADYCRITCKLCDREKGRTCESSKYNCCWDGTTFASGPKGQDCPKIRDDPNARCAMFESECLRNPYYMWTKCRQTCLNSLPPIKPFIQELGPNYGFGLPPPAYGQPAVGSGILSQIQPTGDLNPGIGGSYSRKRKKTSTRQQLNVEGKED
ncbi:papilin-like [Xenia sp. Carnegie-2017]|uniref:papilin-like n=1 Tax=Xenia sp. Carnegie-2017 TaxID=2897299 RepID=UPI001F048A97|nr:papilin-like [Xenia sp. Carnegie-2017]